MEANENEIAGGQPVVGEQPQAEAKMPQYLIIDMKYAVQLPFVEVNAAVKVAQLSGDAKAAEEGDDAANYLILSKVHPLFEEINAMLTKYGEEQQLLANTPPAGEA